MPIKSFQQIQLPNDPAAALQAGTRQYIDTAVATTQPLDSDLTAIAGISPANDDVIQRKAGAWTNRTIAQLKTDLAINAGDPNPQNYPFAGWDLISATVHPDLCTSAANSLAKNALTICRLYVPANTLLTGAAIFLPAAGSTPGATGASGFVLFSDTGTQLAITATDYTVFTTAGWRSKAFSSSYTTGSAGEFLRLGVVATCTTAPTMATAAQNIVNLRDQSRTSTTVRRAVSQASVTTIPSSITPSSYGTALAGLLPLFGVY